jgi:hypothetical protein
MGYFVIKESYLSDVEEKSWSGYVYGEDREWYEEHSTVETWTDREDHYIYCEKCGEFSPDYKKYELTEQERELNAKYFTQEGNSCLSST